MKDKVRYGKFDLVSYELWGNSRDGYEVNAAYYSERDIVIAEDATTKDILRYLKSIGYLKKHLHYSKFEEEGEFQYTLYYSYCGYPAFELRCTEIVE